MIIFLCGPDDYRREAKKQELVAEFCKKHSSLGLEFFDFSEEGTLERFRSFIGNQSIFEPLKLGVLAGIAAVSDKKFPEEIQKFSGDRSITILISEPEKPLTAFGFLLDKKKNLVQEFPILKDAAWRAFVRQAMKDAGVELAPAAFEFISEAYAGDSWRLITELQKLALLPRRRVEREDLERLAVELTPDFWETLQGLKSSSLGRRLATLERLFAKSEPAGKIFNILAYQWPEKLPRFAAYDIAVKSGRCDYEEVLADLLLK